MRTVDLRTLKTDQVKVPESFTYRIKCVEETQIGHGSELVTRYAYVHDGVQWDEIHIDKALRHRSHATEFNWGCESPGCKMLALAFAIQTHGALWAINNYMWIAQKYIYTMQPGEAKANSKGVVFHYAYQTIIVTI